MIIVGITNCGKTHYLLKLLEKEYKNKFGNIFIICPTIDRNTTYLNWKHIDEPNIFALPCNQDYTENYLKYVVDYCKDIPSLIIIDDCASGKLSKSRSSELVRLGFSARHMFISTIVITQQLTSVSKPYRDNISKIVSFYTPNSYDIQVLFNIYLKISKEEENNIQETLKNIRYSYLEISLKYPYGYKLIT